jgi:hypothetical protein
MQRFALLTALIVGFTGCKDIIPPIAPGQSPGISADVVDAGVVQLAHGSGHFSAFGPKPFGWRVFTFNAAEGVDGSIKGEFEVGAPNTEIHAGGDVVCLSVAGNEAWVGVIFRRINVEDLAFIVGWAGFFRVVDNGEGRDASADQITFVDVDPDPSTATAYCRDRPLWQPLNDIEAGNIQVELSNNSFVGSWENNDVDGSHQHMTVSNGSNLMVRLRDDGGTICLNLGLGFVPATFQGFGGITQEDPLTLEATGDVFCYPQDAGGRQLVLENVTLVLINDPLTNTLTSNFVPGDCWYRSGRPESCAP